METNVITFSRGRPCYFILTQPQNEIIDTSSNNFSRSGLIFSCPHQGCGSESWGWNCWAPVPFFKESESGKPTLQASLNLVMHKWPLLYSKFASIRSYLYHYHYLTLFINNLLRLLSLNFNSLPTYFFLLRFFSLNYLSILDYLSQFRFALL